MVASGGLPQIGLQAILDDANFRAGFNNYTRSIDQMIAKTGIASTSVGGQFATLGSAVLGFGAAAVATAAVGVAALTAGVAALGVASVSTAISYESAFAGVLKTTDGLGENMRELTAEGELMLEGFRALSREVPLTFEELARIGELGGQLGIANDQLISFTETIAQLGVSTNLSLEQAAMDFAKIINIMGIGQDEVANMGAAIVELGNNFATTERDIDEFALRIAGAGKIAGLTTADLFGIAAAFTSVGVQAEAGGTAVQKVLISMNTAVIEGGEKLELFAATAGMSAEQFQKAWEDDAGAAFAKFVTGLGIAGDDAIAILDELGLKDQRLIRGFLSVAGAGDLMTRAIEMSNDAYREATALQEEAGRRFATTASRIQILKNNFRDMAFTIGNALLPPLNDLLGVIIEKIVPALQDFSKYIAAVIEDGDYLNDWLTHLPGKMQPVAEAVGRIISAFGELLSGDYMGAMTALGIPKEVQEGIVTFATTLSTFVTDTLLPFIYNHLPELKGALIGIGVVLAGAAIWAGILAIAGAITTLLTPVGLVIALGALLGAAWAGNWLGIREVVDSVVAWVVTVVGGFVAALRGFWQEHGADIQNFFTNAWATLGLVVAAVVDFLGPVIATFIAGVKDGLSTVAPLIASFGYLWEAVAPIIGNQLKILGMVFLAFLAIAGAVLTGIAKAIGPFIKAIVSGINTVVIVFTGIVNILRGLGELVVGIFTGNSEMVLGAFQRMNLGSIQIVGGMAKGVIEIFSFLKEGSIAQAEGLITGFLGVMARLKGGVTGAARETKEGAVAEFADMGVQAAAETGNMTAQIDLLMAQLRGSADTHLGGLNQDATKHWSSFYDTSTSSMTKTMQDTTKTTDDMQAEIDRLLGQLGVSADTHLGGVVSSATKHWSSFYDTSTSKMSATMTDTTASAGAMTADIEQLLADLGVNASAITGTMKSEITSNYQQFYDSSSAIAENLRIDTLFEFIQMKDLSLLTLDNLSKGTSERLLGLSTNWRNEWRALQTDTDTITTATKEKTLASIELMRLGIVAKMLLLVTKWTADWLSMGVATQNTATMIATAVNVMIATIKSLISGGMSSAQTSWQHIWGAIVGTVHGSMQNAIAIVSSALATISNLISTMRGLINIGHGFVSEARAIAAEVASAIASAAAAVGAAASGGITQGIASTSPRAEKAAASTARGVATSMRNELKIASPSKVTEEIGENVNKGLLRGMVGGTSDLRRAIRTMVQRTISEARMAQRVTIPNGGIGAGGLQTMTVYNNTNLEINPTYQQYQSPASVYYDATAALAAARL